MTIQRKAFEQYFHVVLFIMPYKVVLTVKSVGETLVCGHSNESYWFLIFWAVKVYTWPLFEITSTTNSEVRNKFSRLLGKSQV